MFEAKQYFVARGRDSSQVYSLMESKKSLHKKEMFSGRIPFV